MAKKVMSMWLKISENGNNQILLDADPNRRRKAPNDEAMDEDVEMELADIATAVSGNDEGSEEEGSGDESGGEDREADAGEKEAGNDGEQDGSNLEPKKRRYRKQNRARRNGILLFIVSQALSS